MAEHPFYIRDKGQHKAAELLAVSGMMAAVITIMTAYVCHIPVGTNGGYIHFGDAFIYLAAVLLPTPYAAAAGAVGAGLADLLTAPAWTGATVVIKSLIVLAFTEKGEKILTGRNIRALFTACIISVFGYYIADGILFGFHAAFVLSAGQSAVQWAGSSGVFLIMGMTLDKIGFKKRIWRCR